MIKRFLENSCFDPLYGRQMRFIAGPRQVGKTTIAKRFLEAQGALPHYYNWDERKVKEHYREDPHFFHSDALGSGRKTPRKTWVCFDEIHKMPKWKDILKDMFDSFEDDYQFIVTGSARLDLFRKAGDSLSGRFFLFRLLPISLAEMTNRPLLMPSQEARILIEESIHESSHPELEQLIEFSGFPEPLMKANEIFSSSWHDEYLDTLIRQDLRDLTHIQELENVATLLKLLPDKIGAPLSVNAMREEMRLNYKTVKNYLEALVLTYALFRIPPYTKKISRAVQKEQKVYFFDWSLVTDEAKRFENYVACELKNRVEFWTVSSKHRFELFFVRVHGGRETDFLITRDRKPFFLVEAKLSSAAIDSHHSHHARILGDIPLVQLIKTPDTVRADPQGSYVISASRFF